MTKEQLLSLWNADNWEVMSCGVYLTAHRAGKELHINCSDYTEAEAVSYTHLDVYKRQALHR